MGTIGLGSGLGGSSTPTPTDVTVEGIEQVITGEGTDAAPVDEPLAAIEGAVGGGGATLEEDERRRGRIRRRTLGTKQLQIPLTSTGVATGATVDTSLNI